MLILDNGFDAKPELVNPCLTTTGNKALYIRMTYRRLERTAIIIPADGPILLPRDIYDA